MVLFPALCMLICSIFGGGWLTVLAFFALVVGMMLVIWAPTKLQEISLVTTLQRMLGYDG